MFIEVDKTLNRRIANLMKAKSRAKDKHFKTLWNHKLIELLNKEKNNLNLQ